MAVAACCGEARLMALLRGRLHRDAALSPPHLLKMYSHIRIFPFITAAGAIIIEECPVVEVRLTTYDNCTENIPVRVAVTDGEDELALEPELLFLRPGYRACGLRGAARADVPRLIVA